MSDSGITLKGAAKRESKILKLIAMLCGILICAAFATTSQALSSVGLAWDRNPDPTVTGYNVYYGAASGVYTNMLSAGNATSIVISNLIEGVTYYSVVTDYDAAGLESDPSNELAYTVPLPPPQITMCRKLASGNFSVSGRSRASQTCVLWAATSLAAPVVWTPIATNTADINGLFSCSDLRATNYTKRFYRIQAY